jgi:hypothetical protein
LLAKRAKLTVYGRPTYICIDVTPEEIQVFIGYVARGLPVVSLDNREHSEGDYKESECLGRS